MKTVRYYKITYCKNDYDIWVVRDDGKQRLMYESIPFAWEGDVTKWHSACEHGSGDVHDLGTNDGDANCEEITEGEAMLELL